jgi:hypothetical protein
MIKRPRYYREKRFFMRKIRAVRGLHERILKIINGTARYNGLFLSIYSV